MKDFIDELAKDIVNEAKKDIDDGMEKIMQKIVADLTQETFRLIDQYYQTYVPIKYIRLHPPRTLRSGRTPTRKSPSKGPSLHKAVTRNNGEALAFTDYAYKDGIHTYYAGIEFDEDDFKGNSMYHAKKGIEEWDIVEGFLYAGEGRAKGDTRSYPTVSHSDYNYDSADVELNRFIANYDTQFDQHFKNAFPNAK